MSLMDYEREEIGTLCDVSVAESGYFSRFPVKP